MNSEYLEKLVDQYGRLKTEMDSYKKSVEESNAEIKVLMKDANLENFSGKQFKAKYTVVVSESFNEPKLLVKLKELGIEGVIKTKEYVDMEELEKVIYNGEIDPKLLADCKDVKETPRLTISKLKI